MDPDEVCGLKLFARQDEATAMLAFDTTIGPLVESQDPRQLTPASDFFRRFVLSIVRQQLSMTAADTVFERLETTVPITPESVSGTPQSELRESGVSARKADTILRIANAFETSHWSRERFRDMDDNEVIEELTTCKGVGPWTAKMQLLFSLGRPDVFPVEDLGIRQAMTELTGTDLSRAAMCDRAADWRPHRSLASLYLWGAIDSDA